MGNPLRPMQPSSVSILDMGECWTLGLPDQTTIVYSFCFFDLQPNSHLSRYFRQASMLTVSGSYSQGLPSVACLRSSAVQGSTILPAVVWKISAKFRLRDVGEDGEFSFPFRSGWQSILK